jgi:hypothetical protein
MPDGGDAGALRVTSQAREEAVRPCFRFFFIGDVGARSAKSLLWIIMVVVAWAWWPPPCVERGLPANQSASYRIELSLVLALVVLAAASRWPTSARMVADGIRRAGARNAKRGSAASMTRPSVV